MNKNGYLTTIAQCLVEYVEDLLTASPRETFTKVEMLVLLNAVKNDQDLMALLERHSRSMHSSKEMA